MESSGMGRCHQPTLGPFPPSHGGAGRPGWQELCIWRDFFHLKGHFACLFNQISSNLVKLQQFPLNLIFQHESCLQQHEEMVLQMFPQARRRLFAGHECSCDSPASCDSTLFITDPNRADYEQPTCIRRPGWD